MDFLRVLLGFIIFNAVFDSWLWYFHGCGRKFKKGRKCKLWSCPNSSFCAFSAYYKGVELVSPSVPTK